MSDIFFKKVELGNIEYFFDLWAIDNGFLNFLVRINDRIFEIKFNENEDHFLCFEKNNQEKTLVEDVDFIKYHVNNFSLIFNNENLLYSSEENLISNNLNKLIVYSKNLMFFYDAKFDALFRVVNYNVTDIEIIYKEDSLRNINFSKVQKNFNNLVKSAYDLLELKLIKLDMNNLKTAIDSCEDEELANELELEYKKFSQQYHLKLSLANDIRNCSGSQDIFLKNLNYFRIIFSNSRSFKTGKLMCNFFAICNQYFVGKVNFLNMIFARILNSILLPIISFLFEISDLLTADYYYEKRFEISNEIDKILKMTEDFELLVEQNYPKNSLRYLIYNSIDFLLTYTIDLSVFFISEIYYLIKQPINRFKKFIFVI